MFSGELLKWSICHADNVQIYGSASQAEGGEEGDMEEQADIEIPLLRERRDR
jgi:hypothetical protein